MPPCPYCGRENDQLAARCIDCGTPLPQSGLKPPHRRPSELVLLKAFPNEIAAQAAAQALSGSGVPSNIQVENCAGLFPPLEIYRGFQLFVRAEDVERARSILADFESASVEVDAETAERVGAMPVADAPPGSGLAGWSAGQEALLWFLVGLVVGAAITGAVLRDGHTWRWTRPAEARSRYTGVREEDTDRDGKSDRWFHYVDGQIDLVEEDTNYDGKPDQWFFYEERLISRYERDVNFDGKPDVWGEYSRGRLTRVIADTDFDGRPDRWTYYRDGLEEREEIDRNGDGRPDVWYYLRGGEIERDEVDQNFDGKVDQWTDYRDNQPVTRKADTDFNGKPDMTHSFVSGVLSKANWVDQETGRLWKRVSYRNGWLHEALVDTDRDGAFDTRITYDAFENPVETVKLNEPAAGSPP